MKIRIAVLVFIFTTLGLFAKPRFFVTVSEVRVTAGYYVSLAKLFSDTEGINIYCEFVRQYFTNTTPSVKDDVWAVNHLDTLVLIEGEPPEFYLKSFSMFYDYSVQSGKYDQRTLSCIKSCYDNIIRQMKEQDLSTE